MSEESPQGFSVKTKFDAGAVREHYDRLTIFYRTLWGEHIHHGFWEDSESPAIAKVKLIERLAARAGVTPNAHVLDVGCGLGGSSLWLAQNLSCSVLGLNISSVQVALAREAARAKRLDDRVRFKVFDADLLESLDESFDVVWVIECSEHLKDKRRFIHNCARLSKPGGVLALCAWLQTDPLPSPDHAQLIAEICLGMLCPQLASMQDYTGWMSEGGFERIVAEEITPHVKETWAHCAAIIRQPQIKALSSTVDERTRRFVETFALMQKAYNEGAMAYGMFTAKKSC